jgi:hypothetical protein
MQTVWLLPFLLWAATQSGNGDDWQTAATLAIACATFGSALWPGWGSGGRLVPDTA